MRMRRGMPLAAGLIALFTLGAVPAWATEPVTLGAERVFDGSDVLTGSQEAAANERLTELSSSTGVDLYVVFVDEFTNPDNSQQWADAVAGDNGLGPDQYVFAVGTESRQFYISADNTGPLTADDLLEIENAVTPELSAQNWPAAVSTAADGFESAAGPSNAGGGLLTGVLGLIVVALIVGFVIWFIVRSRKKRSNADGVAAAGPAVITTEELQRQAGSALVQTDDAVKTSEQELGFARAQFGDDATVEFDAALTAAKQNLSQAFALKQKLDDTEADSEEQVHAWNAEIVRLCAAANEGLDEKAEAFDELRQLEKNAPEAHARVAEDRAEVAAAIDQAEAALRALSQRYAPEALATVADNPAQARSRIAFADEQLAEAQRDIGAGKGGEAAVGIRAAEEAVGQARLLETAIDTLGADLGAAETEASALLAELEQDLIHASALPDPDGRVAGVVGATRQQIALAKTNLDSAALRPIVALQSLESANTEIDAVIAGVRDAEAQAQRARQVLGQTLLQAQGQVSAAEDYITARRGGVGATARTRLAEAGATLVQAQQLQSSDPVQALVLAQRALQLGSEATQTAQADVGSFQNQSQGQSGGNNMLGAMLGGIVINSLLGGGSRSSGGGMGSLGGLFGGGGGGGSSRGGARISPGSFGGGGTRGRRGGGRF